MKVQAREPFYAFVVIAARRERVLSKISKGDKAATNSDVETDVNTHQTVRRGIFDVFVKVSAFV